MFTWVPIDETWFLVISNMHVTYYPIWKFWNFILKKVDFHRLTPLEIDKFEMKIKIFQIDKYLTSMFGIAMNWGFTMLNLSNNSQMKLKTFFNMLITWGKIDFELRLVIVYIGSHWWNLFFSHFKHAFNILADLKFWNFILKKLISIR